jgi:hypothetical protein
MLTIAGGLVLGGIGLVAAYFVIAFIVMYLAEAWNICFDKTRSKPQQFPLKPWTRDPSSDPPSHRQ